jgi:hypothetical protein
VNRRPVGHTRTEWAIEFTNKYDPGQTHVLLKDDEAAARRHSSHTGATLLRRTVTYSEFEEVSDEAT